MIHRRGFRMDQLENEYRKFFDEAIVGLCRWDLKTGRFLLANQHCAEMFGHASPAELLASPETIGKLCGKDTKQRLVGRLKKEGSVEGFEMPLFVGSRTIWVAAYVHINCGGTCVQGTLIDITDQKQSEFEIENLKAKQLVKLHGISDKLDTLMRCYE